MPSAGPLQRRGGLAVALIEEQHSPRVDTSVIAHAGSVLAVAPSVQDAVDRVAYPFACFASLDA